MGSSENNVFEVVLITGIAAVGKSTLSRQIGNTQGFKAFEYGVELFNQAAQKHKKISHSDTRSHSEFYVSDENIRNTDKALQLFIQKYRNECHVVIDSLAVSIEKYVLRSEPFAVGELQQANF